MYIQMSQISPVLAAKVSSKRRFATLLLAGTMRKRQGIVLRASIADVFKSTLIRARCTWQTVELNGSE